jgi:hypothetical protein
MSVRISCIEKDGGNHENPYVAISYLQWINENTSETGRTSRVDMYDFVVNKNGQAYVRDVYGNIGYLMGAISKRGNKYVKTVADETKTDNLLKFGRM